MVSDKMVQGPIVSNFYGRKKWVQPLFLRILKNVFYSNTFKQWPYILMDPALQMMGPALLFITELDSPFMLMTDSAQLTRFYV